MKKLWCLTSVIFLSMSTLGLRAAGYKNLDAAAIQKLKSGEIISSIHLLPNSKIHKCELIGLIQAPILTVWNVLSDYGRYHEFMPRTPVTFLVDSEALNAAQENKLPHWKQFEEHLKKHQIDSYSTNPFYFYNRFKMPFPLKDRYYVLKMERIPEIFESRWIEIFGNTHVNKGSWTLIRSETSPDTTIAVYSIEVDPGLALPPKILSSAMKKLPEIIRALRQHIQKETVHPQQMKSQIVENPLSNLN